MESAAVAILAVVLALSPARSGPDAARTSKQFDCVFSKAGAPSKLRVKLDGKGAAEEGDVFRGRIWLDKKPLFPGSIKFLYSKKEDGKATLGAGVLTQKRTLFYSELFINLDPESGEATLEAATTGVTTTLQGSCVSK